MVYENQTSMKYICHILISPLNDNKVRNEEEYEYDTNPKLEVVYLIPNAAYSEDYQRSNENWICVYDNQVL